MLYFFVLTKFKRDKYISSFSSFISLEYLLRVLTNIFHACEIYVSTNSGGENNKDLLNFSMLHSISLDSFSKDKPPCFFPISLTPENISHDDTAKHELFDKQRNIVIQK